MNKSIYEHNGYMSQKLSDDLAREMTKASQNINASHLTVTWVKTSFALKNTGRGERKKRQQMQPTANAH